MARSRDKDRLIWLLQEQGRSSNRNVRTVLKLSDEKYIKIRAELLEAGLVEKVRGQGGGLQITALGIREKTLPRPKSAVDNEKALYAPFIKILEAECEENEEAAVVIDTSALRKSGKWSNPDITTVSIRKFPILREALNNSALARSLPSARSEFRDAQIFG